MLKGLKPIKPHRKDYDLLKTHGLGALPVSSMLPADYSNYAGEAIPNQELPDARFNPSVGILAYGCTGETAAFDSGLQDAAVYRPDIPYLLTPPGVSNEGRDMRAMLETLIDQQALMPQSGPTGKKRLAYFNVYAAGAIDDFDAAKIALWINQSEKRSVWAGSWWYPEFSTVGEGGILPLPSFDVRQASLHAHLITGWKTIDGVEYLESLSWQGMDYGRRGVVYFSRELWNSLMGQPYTGMFTITKMPADSPVPVGMQATVDHLVYLVRQLFHV